jgi:hypothetical protein
MARRVALLLFCCAATLAAEETDDVDRTSFSDPALQEDKPPGPHEDVDPASLLPNLVDEGKVPVGVPSQLLVSLSNLGGKMFNVTSIDGYVADAATGEKVKGFAKQQYGEPLGPREQRSFQYLFTPDGELKTGSYRLVFKAYFQNRDKDRFLDVVYNETAELVPAPISNDDFMMMVGVGVSAGVLVLALAGLFLVPGKKASSSKKGGKEKAAKNSGVQDEWLEGTCATASPGKKKKKAA